MACHDLIRSFRSNVDSFVLWPRLPQKPNFLMQVVLFYLQSWIRGKRVDIIETTYGYLFTSRAKIGKLRVYRDGTYKRTHYR